jgi:hypothetical protein
MAIDGGKNCKLSRFFVPGIGVLGMKWCSSVEHDFYGPLTSQQAIPICMFVCLINIFGGVFKWT